MVAGALHSVLNPATVITVSLIFLATPGHASAQTFLKPLQRCGALKAYAVIIKLLAVYASHILTIKVEPGLKLSDTILRYGKLTQSIDKCRKYTIAAACSRFKRQDIPPGAIILSPTRVVRAKPLRVGNGEDEVFSVIPRGTPANLFVPMMIQSSSASMKGPVGTIQLIYATLQLLSVSDPQVAAYDYGAFTYTIIPYALGSVINLIAVLCTGHYVDLTEVEIDRGDPDAANAIQWRQNGIPMAWLIVGVCEFAVYLAIVGGVTRFSPGISFCAQRAWFLSWALSGRRVCFRPSLPAPEGGHSDLWTDMWVELVPEMLTMAYRALTDLLDTTPGRILGVSLFWVPTVGGVVAMIQQYLRLFQC